MKNLPDNTEKWTNTYSLLEEACIILTRNEAVDALFSQVPEVTGTKYHSAHYTLTKIYRSKWIIIIIKKKIIIIIIRIIIKKKKKRNKNRQEKIYIMYPWMSFCPIYLLFSHMERGIIAFHFWHKPRLSMLPYMFFSLFTDNLLDEHYCSMVPKGCFWILRNTPPFHKFTHFLSWYVL